MLDEVPLPSALLPGGPYLTKAQEAALERIGRSLLDGGGRYPAIESVLRRAAFDRDVQTNDLEELTALLLSLGGRHLVVQGPPGSGKTWTSGRLIARLVDAGKRVGVASTSHRAIHKLLDEVVEGAAGPGDHVHGPRLKKASGGNPESQYAGRRRSRTSSTTPTATTASFSAARPGSSPTASTTACSTTSSSTRRDRSRWPTRSRWRPRPATSSSSATRSSSARCSRARIPTGARRRCSSTCWTATATIPPNRGIFLETTYRLHPDVCGFISEEFYEGRLRPDPVTSDADDAVRHGAALARRGARRRTARTRPRRSRPSRRRSTASTAAGVAPAEIKVVAPYNAQVDRLRAALPAAVEVGTVDKFQGQQARVVFYSMASSSGEDVPRGLDFLFSRNRLQRRDLAGASASRTSSARRGCSRSTAARSTTCGSPMRCAASWSSRPSRARDSLPGAASQGVSCRGRAGDRRACPSQRTRPRLGPSSRS